MGAITINLPDELENKFRKYTTIRFGDRQGKLSKGAVEALKDWCMRQQRD